MELFNTVLLLLGLLAFVMYFKNLFDIKEGVLSDSTTRNRRRCPSGYKKNPTLVQNHKRPRTENRRLLVRNMKNYHGRNINGSHYNRLYNKQLMKVYDYECKGNTGGVNKMKQANAAKQLIAAGAKQFSYTA